MILKNADDKSADVDVLEALHKEAEGDIQRRIAAELRNMRSGVKGEKDAAYLIDFDFGKSKNTAVIHDLRLELAGRVAQIDHLLFHRSLLVFVAESKHFHAGIKINEQGEFLQWNDFKKTYEGIPSPIEQNRRHVEVLYDVISQNMVMPSRLGITLEPKFASTVIVSKNARIDRSNGFDSREVIKADMLSKHVEQVLDYEMGLTLLAKLVDTKTLVDVCEQLIALHRPARVDWRAKFFLRHKQAAALLAPCSSTLPATTEIQAFPG